MDPLPPELQLFDCARRPTLRITPIGCAGSWRKAKGLPDKSEDTSMRCRGCAIGAGHAGQAITASRAPSKTAQRECTRCGRMAWKLVKGVHCVSCYNRQMEVVRGCNGKGTVPVKAAAAIHTTVVGAAGPVGVQPMAVTVTSAREAALAAIRNSGAAAFTYEGIALGQDGNVQSPEGAQV